MYHVSFVGEFPVVVVVRVGETEVVAAGEAFCPQLFLVADAEVFSQLQLLYSLTPRQILSYLIAKYVDAIGPNHVT